ncbi:hypothetical protein [Kosmotoga pacifica]|uniref:Uncharacterized protein n=1 Tax=Kosmotoga pacifica TaxID=1330330 RepID=A0A0G2ZEC5_9BACT|nr:hypothetical protein [Kosmotoga pacifica]AKI97183.1 hypothetical protein IX53_04450 [Kosmotoga pacifica]
MITLLMDVPLYCLSIYQLFSGKFIMPLIVLAFSLFSIYAKKWLFIRTIILSMSFVLLYFLEYSRNIDYLFPLLSAASNLLQLVIGTNFSQISIEKVEAGQKKHYVFFALVIVTGIMTTTTLLFFEPSFLALVFFGASVGIIVSLMNIYIRSYLTRSAWSAYVVKQLMVSYYITYMRGGRKHPARTLDDPIKSLRELRARLLLKMPDALSVKNAFTALFALMMIIAIYLLLRWFAFPHAEAIAKIFLRFEEYLKFLNSAGGELF